MSKTIDSDRDWELWGATDPYYGVITDERFRSNSITHKAKEDFFASGDAHVRHVLEVCRRHLDPNPALRSVLDFGCGVGRVALPFAKHAETVVAVDVATSMLSEAERNCVEHAVNNVVLRHCSDELTGIGGPFDLVHSCIVLQHIETSRGRSIFGRLVDLVAPEGLGAIHVTYGLAAYAPRFGRPPTAQPTENAEQSLSARILNPRSLLGKAMRKKGEDRTDGLTCAVDPHMSMHYYDVGELFFILQQRSIKNLYVEFTDHGGALGVFLFFQKPGVRPS